MSGSIITDRIRMHMYVIYACFSFRLHIARRLPPTCTIAFVSARQSEIWKYSRFLARGIFFYKNLYFKPHSARKLSALGSKIAAVHGETKNMELQRSQEMLMVRRTQITTQLSITEMTFPEKCEWRMTPLFSTPKNSCSILYWPVACCFENKPENTNHFLMCACAHLVCSMERTQGSVVVGRRDQCNVAGPLDYQKVQYTTATVV